MNKTNDVVGLGNTLMDFLVDVNENILLDFNLTKGETQFVDEIVAQNILQKIAAQKLSLELVPGGSSANTIRGVAFLGGKGILCGKVGNDPHGEQYILGLEKMGVISRIKRHASYTTGHAVAFITPDAQRTFSVHLGAAVTLAEEDLSEEDIKSSKILHIEGYQLEGFTKSAVLKAFSIAKENDTICSLDFADPGVVRRNKSFLQEMINTFKPIVFANELEAKEYTGIATPKEAAKLLGKDARVVILKVGEKGAFVSSKDDAIFVPAFPVKAVDTTGAGDCFAAGFLYGYCYHWPLQKAACLGALLASKVVEQRGVKISHLNAEELKKRVLHN